jgi:hypothetical protein
MSLLIAALLFLTHRAEPQEALDLSFGPGFILHDVGVEGLGQEVFAGAVLELSYAQKEESLWLEFGLSGLVGGDVGMNSGLSSDVIRGGGIHFDAAYSMLQSRYVDLKLGIGAGAKYLQRVHEEKTMDKAFEYHLESRRTTSYFEVGARGLVALNLHGRGGMGGIEFRPIKGELGPSFFDMTPSLAVYWPI